MEKLRAVLDALCKWYSKLLELTWFRYALQATNKAIRTDVVPTRFARGTIAMVFRKGYLAHRSALRLFERVDAAVCRHTSFYIAVVF